MNLKNKTKHVHYEALPDFEGFDEISIKVVPRFKTSGLSGDEWRISAVVTIKRRGELVLERTFSKMAYATRYLSWVTEVELGEKTEVKRGLYGHYQDECAQAGCDQKPVNHYVIKKLYVNGHALPNDEFTEHRRAFCERHSKRGDSDFEDNDDNYELVEGPGFKRVHPKDVSESVFGGVIDLTDKPKEALE